jgi:hypothetical protein
MRDVTAKQEANARLARALHGIPEPDEGESEDLEPQSPDFDGGVREPVPLPSDPVEEHHKLVVGLARLAAYGGGGQW